MKTTREVEAHPYRAGIPTEIDVRALRARYPDESLTVGLVIPYPDVADIIRARPKTDRFATVTCAWRRQVETATGVVIDAPGNKTFQVATPSRILVLSRRRSRQAVRSAGRSLELCSLVDRSGISTDEKKSLDHTATRNGKMLAAAQMIGPANLPALSKGKEKRPCNSTR